MFLIFGFHIFCRHALTVTLYLPFCGSVRCAENLMTSSNLATVFVPCLLPPPNKAEMSEGRLELRVLVLRAFIENPHMFGNKPIIFSPLAALWELMMSVSSALCFLGVIPKSVMDSVGFLRNFHFPKDSKRGHKRRHSFRGIRIHQCSYLD